MNLWTVRVISDLGLESYLRFDNAEGEFNVTDCAGEAIVLPQAEAQKRANALKQAFGDNLGNYGIKSVELGDVEIGHPKFITVKASTLYGFDQQVNNFIKATYVPQGGLQVQDGSFYLAMTKPEAQYGTRRAYRQP